MRNESVIYTHERWQQLPFLDFIADQLGKEGHGPPPTLASATGQVAAYINHSRWVADCPSGDGGAVVVSRETPFFMCPICANIWNDGQWANLLFPEKVALQEIEGLLLVRPRDKRNWYPWETLDQLRAENLEAGL